MRRTLLAGALLALGAALLAVHGGHLGLEATRIALYGVTLGAVLGLVREGSPAARTGAFAAGFLACWAAYLLRAGVLPDIPMGRAVAAVLVVAVVTAVAVLSRDRLPLWAGLLGAGMFAGAYETTFTATPSAISTESVTAATTVLVAASVGYLIAVLVRETAPAPHAEPGIEVGVTHVVAVPEQRATTTDIPARTEA